MDYSISDRFRGKTLIVTGCARGMGAAAAIRAAREGTNIVGVDWIQDLGAATIQGIKNAGGKAIFVYGDITETAVCERMVKTAVDTFGRLDLALDNAGVMDGVFSGDAPNYAKQKELIFAPIHEASDSYWHSSQFGQHGSNGYTDGGACRYPRCGSGKGQLGLSPRSDEDLRHPRWFR